MSYDMHRDLRKPRGSSGLGLNSRMLFSIGMASGARALAQGNGQKGRQFATAAL